MRDSFLTCLILSLLLFFTARGFAADNELTPAEKAAGWLLLFDGKTYDGWMTSDQKTSKRPIQDGAINPHGCGASTTQSGRWIWVVQHRSKP